MVNPFTPDAYFDYDLFKKHVGLAQRIMDDIIDLESEKIEMILAKIDSDPGIHGGKTNRASFVGKDPIERLCKDAVQVWALRRKAI